MTAWDRLRTYLSDERHAYSGPRHRRRSSALADLAAFERELASKTESLRLALSREREANRDWSTAAREWIKERSALEADFAEANEFMAATSLCEGCQVKRAERAIIATPRIQVEEERDELRQQLDWKPDERVVIVYDSVQWHVRRLRLSAHDLDRDEMVYRCDEPLANDCRTLHEAIEEVRKKR